MLSKAGRQTHVLVQGAPCSTSPSLMPPLKPPLIQSLLQNLQFMEYEEEAVIRLEALAARLAAAEDAETR